MAVMLMIMMLPAFGLALFYFWPLASALPIYLVLLAFSGFFHVLMMKSKRRYVGTGPEALVGAPAVVLAWKGRSGQVRVHGEIWRALSRSETPAKRDDVFHVVEVEGLTLIVERRSGRRPAFDSQRGSANVPPLRVDDEGTGVSRPRRFGGKEMRTKDMVSAMAVTIGILLAWAGTISARPAQQQNRQQIEMHMQGMVEQMQGMMDRMSHMGSMHGGGGMGMMGQGSGEMYRSLSDMADSMNGMLQQMQAMMKDGNLSQNETFLGHMQQMQGHMDSMMTELNGMMNNLGPKDETSR